MILSFSCVGEYCNARGLKLFSGGTAQHNAGMMAELPVLTAVSHWRQR